MALRTAFETAATPPLPVLTSGPVASLASLPSLGGPISGPAKDQPADLGAISQANDQRQATAQKINTQATQGLKDIAKAQNSAAPQSGGVSGFGTVMAAMATPFFPGASTALAAGGLAADFALSSFKTYSSTRAPSAGKEKKVKNDEASVFQTASTNTAATSASMQVNRTVDVNAFARASALNGASPRSGISDNVKAFSNAGSTSSYGDYALAGDTLRGIERMKLSLKDAQLNSARVLRSEVPQLNAVLAERKSEGLTVTGANIAQLAERGPALRQTSANKLVAFGV